MELFISILSWPLTGKQIISIGSGINYTSFRKVNNKEERFSSFNPAHPGIATLEKIIMTTNQRTSNKKCYFKGQVQTQL